MRLPAFAARLAKLAKRPWCFAALLWAGILLCLAVLADVAVMPLVARQFAFRESVPDVRGMTKEEAEKRLADEHLNFRWAKVGRYSSEVAAGGVLLQIPGPGREVKRGRTVFLTPSKGVREVAVPDLRGQSQRQASLSLQRLGLERGPDVAGAHLSIPYNVIIRTIPAPGSLVRVGDTVSLVISKGATSGKKALPDLRRAAVADARAKLADLGFAAVVDTLRDARPDTSFLPGTVFGQYPLGGEYLGAGDSVRLTVVP